MKDAFRELIDGLLPDALQANVLLASMVALETGDKRHAARLFATVRRKGLSEWQQALWKRMQVALGRRRRR